MYALYVCLICMPYMYALHVRLRTLGIREDSDGVCALYACLIWLPYVYALCVYLMCMPYVYVLGVLVCLICMPYMVALHVCLICMPYMYASQDHLFEKAGFPALGRDTAVSPVQWQVFFSKTEKK